MGCRSCALMLLEMLDCMDLGSEGCERYRVWVWSLRAWRFVFEVSSSSLKPEPKHVAPTAGRKVLKACQGLRVESLGLRALFR